MCRFEMRDDHLIRFGGSSRNRHPSIMRFETDGAQIDNYIIGGNGSSTRYDFHTVLDDKRSDGTQHPKQDRSRGVDMPHDGQQLLSQFNSKLLDTLTRLVKTSLHSIVEDVIFTGSRRSLLESLVGLLCFPLHHVKVISECREHLRHTDTIHTQVLEHRSQDSKAICRAKVVNALQEHHQALVCAALQCLSELVHLKPNELSDFSRLLEQVHSEFAKRRSGHFHLLTIGIKRSTESKQLWNCQISLRTNTSHTLCELHKVRLRSRTVLRQHIHSRTNSQHRIACPHQIRHPENIRQLGNRLSGTLTKVNQSHIDNVSRFHIALHILQRILTQSSCFLSQFIELFTGSTGVHLLESRIEFKHLFLRHSRIFSGVGKLLVHFGVCLDSITPSHDKASECSDASH